MTPHGRFIDVLNDDELPIAIWHNTSGPPYVHEDVKLSATETMLPQYGKSKDPTVTQLNHIIAVQNDNKQITEEKMQCYCVYRTADTTKTIVLHMT